MTDQRTDPDVVRLARELVAVGRDDERAAAVLRSISSDAARLRAVALHLGKITSTLAQAAAQMAAEALARGVDAPAVQPGPGSVDGVLALVYRLMDDDGA